MARNALILPLLAILGVAAAVPIARAAPAPAAAKPSAPTPLRFDRLLLNTGGRRAEMCLRFGSSLDDNRAADYAAHVTLVPATRPEIRIASRDLCIGGLSFGTRYALTLAAGIRGAEGSRLNTDLHLTMTLADQPATVALSGDGSVLPRTTATGIEVQTVNVARVRIHLFRMSQAASVAKTAPTSDYPRVDLSTTAMSGDDVRALRDSQVSEVWTGTMDVEPARNRTVRTAFPIAGIIHGQRPGLYLVTAENATTPASASPVSGDGTSMASDGMVAAHWVNVTDIGLGTIEGKDGLHVVARSGADRLPRCGIIKNLDSIEFRPRPPPHRDTPRTNSRPVA